MEENQDIRIIRRLATELKIPVLRDRLDHYIEQCGLHNWDIPHLLAVIMQDQMAHRAETRRRNLIKRADFPQLKISRGNNRGGTPRECSHCPAGAENPRVHTQRPESNTIR